MEGNKDRGRKLDQDNLLNSLLETIPDSIFFKDKEHRFVLVSKSKANHVGTTPEAMIGKTDYDFYPDEIARSSRKDDRYVLENEQALVGKEEQVQRHDGEIRWVSTTKVPRYDSEGNLIGTLGISRDITERREHHKKLEAIEELSREIKLKNDKSELFRLILKRVKKLFDYGSCAICERQGNEIEIVQVGGDYSPQVEKRKMNIEGKGPIPAACRKKEPLYVENVSADDRYLQGSPSPGSEFVVPIQVEQKLYGALDFESERIGGISRQDRELLGIVASQTAVALQGIERLTQLNRQRGKLKKLHEAVDRLQQCKDEEAVLKTTIEVAEKILGFKLCAIGIVKGDSVVTEITSTKLDLDQTSKFAIGEGITGKSVQRGETIWGDDLSNHPEARPVTEDFKAFISTPIGKLGNFQAVSKEIGFFQREDVELAEILAGHLREEIKRIRLEEELKERAIRDPLTGLYNRRYFNQSLEKEVQRCIRYDHYLGFLMLDINRFKEINDRYSHLTGDEILKSVGKLLKNNVRSADTVVRYGGDEFLIMTPETNGEVKNTVGRLRKKLSQWNEESDLLDFPLTLAIGISHWNPNQDRDVEEALKEADREMYKDKEEKSRY